tara:strand:- start:15 stop:155 length:141 start_codon:yes stop_codon:yes gene_type:complete
MSPRIANLLKVGSAIDLRCVAIATQSKTSGHTLATFAKEKAPQISV